MQCCFPAKWGTSISIVLETIFFHFHCSQYEVGMVSMWMVATILWGCHSEHVHFVFMGR